MSTQPDQSVAEVSFGPSRHRLFLQLMLALVLWIVSSALLGALRLAGWAAIIPGAGLLIWVIPALIRYNAEAVIVGMAEIALRSGTWRTTEEPFALLRVKLRYEQTWLGRVFDYGTLTCALEDRVMVVVGVGGFADLRRLIAARRAALYHQQLRDLSLLPALRM